MSELEHIKEYIEGLTPEAVEFMKKLVSIKALGPLNGGDGEGRKAKYVKSYLHEHGFDNIEEYPAPDSEVPDGERPNFIVRIPGRNPDRTVWIMAHLDVVPAGDPGKWDTDPFEAVVKEGRIYGRGTEDNHQGLVSAVMAARAFIDLDIKPAFEIALLFVSDEETGNRFGLDYVVHQHADLFRKEDIFIVPDAGEPDSSMIEVAEKSILWLHFKTLGKQVHASVPAKGINAFRAASALVVALEELHDIYDASDSVFDPPECTFEPTKKEANVPNVNTIPGEDIFYLDCRILPQYDLEEVKETVRKICDGIEEKYHVSVEFSAPQEEQAAPATPVDAEVVMYLQRAVKDVYGIDAKPMGIGGGTVAAFFRKAGFHTAVWSTIQDLAHQPNEFCVINDMMQDAKVFAHVCLGE
jgi:succinyl-diaminopimelate desuccinylase